jgi:ketosteroid isomerase-like protein
MSQENVEIVRRSFEHQSATGEPLWELIDPEVEWVIDPTGLLAGTYRGHEGVKTFFERLREAFDRAEFEIDRLVDVGESVVVLGRFRFHGEGSGVAAEQSAGWGAGVRRGAIVSARVYFRQAEALEAVGLRE